MSDVTAPPTSPSAPGKPPVVVWDLVLTIAFVLIAVVVVISASVPALFLVMATDSCGAVNQCNLDLATSAWVLTLVGPGVVVVISIVLAISLVIRRRVAFWAPLAGLVLGGAVYALGVTLFFSAVS